jgi:hypothetical protein
MWQSTEGLARDKSRAGPGAERTSRERAAAGTALLTTAGSVSGVATHKELNMTKKTAAVEQRSLAPPVPAQVVVRMVRRVWGSAQAAQPCQHSDSDSEPARRLTFLPRTRSPLTPARPVC